MPKIPFIENPKQDAVTDTTTSRGRPMLFQVLDPYFDQPLYPVLLALHVNPETLEERMSKSKNVAMTYGGWVEWNWPDELSSLSAQASTGGFLAKDTGLTVGNERNLNSRKTTGRQNTIAWERQQDLLELFHNNGMVFDSAGRPAIRGRLMCIYDRGLFIGHFTTFDVMEDDTHPFTFQLSWEYQVERAIYLFPGIQNP